MVNRTLQYNIQFGKEKLKTLGIENYTFEVHLMLINITGLDKVSLITKDYHLTDQMLQKYNCYLNQRLEGKPLQYILKECEFMGLNLYVNESVLIPRQDTELLVETAIDYIKQNKYKSILEIGTGTGCIPIAIAKNIDRVEITACDISKKALDIAKKNSVLNNVEDDITFIYSDIYNNVKGKYDLIISNPPYIESAVINTLEDTVKKYEPLLALDGHEDGLYFYNAIVLNSLDYLNDYGIILFEIGYNQKEKVVKLLERKYKYIKVLKDLSGRNRVVVASNKEV